MSRRVKEFADPETEAFIKKIAERLKQLRGYKGFKSQETFAYEKEINRVQYSRYERAEEDFRMSTLLKITKAFNITLEEFFSEGFE